MVARGDKWRHAAAGLILAGLAMAWPGGGGHALAAPVDPNSPKDAIPAAHQKYYEQVWRRLARFWAPPAKSDPDQLEGRLTVLVIRLDTKGRIVNTQMDRSSGVPAWGESAIWAVARAAPFPPPSPGLGSGGFLEFGLNFRP